MEDQNEQRPTTIMTLRELETHHIEYAMLVLGANKTKVAEALGITVKTLYNKLQEYGLKEKYTQKPRKA